MTGVDDLTGLPGRGAFLRHLEEEIATSGPEGIPFCLLIIDLDYLKLFNDHYGHVAGDEALRVVARALQTHLRSDEHSHVPAMRRLDLPSRYGGDEFVALLPNTTLEIGLQVAERLRSVTVARPLTLPGVAVNLTVSLSIGVACYPQDGAGAAALFAVADQGVYAAKAAGRNVVRHMPLAAAPAEPAAPTFSPQSRLIARQAELHLLLQSLEDACQGRGGLALVEGEAGIGKSRLMAELADLGRLLGVRTLRVCCHQVEMTSPYAPLLEMLTPLVEGAPAKTLSHVAAGWAGEVARLLPALGRRLPDSLPLPALPSLEDRGRLQEALCAFVLGVGSSSEIGAPFMVLIDDMHWLDDASARVLHRLARQLHTAPLLVVGAVRSEELAANTTLTQAIQALQRQDLLRARIVLPPLTTDDMRTLLHTIVGLGWRDDALQRRLVQETGGNPLFLLETLSLLAERGSLRREGGDWRPVGMLGAATLPLAPTVRAVIEARLAGLEQNEAHVLAIAAVLGRPFALKDVQAASGLPEEETLTALDRLEQRRLIMPAVTGRPAGYDYVHPQIQEVVHQDLSASRKRLLHRRVARALAERSAPPGEVAEHYWRGDEPQPALPLFIQAAQAARAVHAVEEGIAAYQRALAASEALMASGTPPEELGQAALYEQLGELQTLAGAWEGAVAAFKGARAALKAGPDRSGPADAVARQAQLWHKEGMVWAARGAYQQALAAFDEAEGQAAPLLGQGRGDRTRRQHDHVAEHGSGETGAEDWKALAAGKGRRRSGERIALPVAVQAAIDISRGEVFERQGAYRAAMAAATRALTLVGGGDPGSGEVYTGIEDGAVVSRAQMLLGNLAWHRGDHSHAEDCYCRARAIYARIGDQQGEANALYCLGRIAWYQGAYDQAQAYHEQSLAIRERVGDQPGMVASWCMLGLVAWHRGAFKKAEESYGHARAVQDRIGDYADQPMVWYGSGELACERGEFAEARSLCRRARQRAHRMGMRMAEGEAALGQAHATLRAIEHAGGADAGTSGWQARAWRLAEALTARADMLANAYSLADLATAVALRTAELRLGLGALPEAYQAAEEALRQASAAQQRREEALAHRLLGQCALAGGNSTAGIEHLRTALAELEAIGAEVEVARTQLILAPALHEMLGTIRTVGAEGEARAMLAMAAITMSAQSMHDECVRAEQIQAGWDAMGPPNRAAAGTGARIPFDGRG